MKRIIVVSVVLIAALCLTVPGWAKGPVKLKQSSTCTGPTIMVGTVSACTSGTSVEVPMTINDTAGQSSCMFSVEFDNTKLQYTGNNSGTMGASLLLAGVPDINSTGKVQPIVFFEEGGATSGTISSFKFTLLADIPESAEVDLSIGDIGLFSFCGESGAVQCGTSSPETWDDVVDIYENYTKGTATWDEVIAAYQAYVNQQS